MMELKKNGAFQKIEEDKKASYKQFTQCCLPSDTQLQCRATKEDTESVRLIKCLNKSICYETHFHLSF
jgi:hypothetical protein